MIKAESVEDLFQKVAAGIVFGLVGVAFGFMGGGIYESIGIYTEILPWQEFLTFLGGLAGFGFGATLKK